MNALATALVKAQKEFPAIPKDAINPHFKNRFASLGVVMEKVLPVLNKNGIAVLQFPTMVGGLPALRTKLIHAESGEFEEDTMLLMLAKNDPQGQGSALTYARRYAVLATLGLVADDDDDGQAASTPRTRPSVVQAHRPSAKQQKEFADVLMALGGLDPKDWNAVAEKYASREFNKMLADLTPTEFGKVYNQFLSHLETLREAEKQPA